MCVFKSNERTSGRERESFLLKTLFTKCRHTTFVRILTELSWTRSGVRYSGEVIAAIAVCSDQLTAAGRQDTGKIQSAALAAKNLGALTVERKLPRDL